MANLTVWHAAKDVSAAITSFVSTYSVVRKLSKKDSLGLRLALKRYEAEAKVAGLGAVARASVQEIEKTLTYIEEQSLHGEAKSFAMEMLTQLNVALKRNYIDYYMGLQV